MLKEVKDFKLPKEFRVSLSGKRVNLSLLAQALHVYEERAHLGLRKTKTRAEVKRTGKKVYRQKGTGGARHGSRRAPIYVGGGVAHGPRPIRRVLNLPEKTKRMAKLVALSLAKVVVASGFGTLAKTREAQKFVSKLGGKRFLFLLSEKNKKAAEKIKNLAGVKVKLFAEANAFDIIKGGILILDREVFAKK